MAGTVVGISNTTCAFANATLVNYTFEPQMIFYNFWRFMDLMIAAGYAERIAYNHGESNYGPGNGIGYPTDAVGFGNRAFAVWKMKGTGSGNSASSRSFDYYIHVQSGYNPGTASPPYGPLLISNSTGTEGCGFDMAFREDGLSPWNGTTNNDGSDSKADPVWTDGGVTTLHVMNYSNSPSGNHSTSRENLAPLTQLTTTSSQFRSLHMAGDADSFVAVQVYNNEPYFSYGGIYIPRSGFSPTYPLIMLSTKSPFARGPYGTAAGGGNLEGGIWLPTVGVVPYKIGYDGDGLNDSATYHPNAMYDPPRLMDLPILIGTPSPVGHPGTFDPALITQTACQQFAISNSGTRAYFGAAGYARQFGIPWGDTVGVELRRDREGTSF